MLRPSPSRLKSTQEASTRNFSNAAKQRRARQFANSKIQYPADYNVIDIETTGLNHEVDEIVEIGALKVVNHTVVDTFHAFVSIEGKIPTKISELTGITEKMVNDEGKALCDVLNEFLTFLGELPIVAHNADFDTNFLLQGCIKCKMPLFDNRCIDTLVLAKRRVHGMENYKLSTLAARFNIKNDSPHRGLGDCEATMLLYEKLIKFSDMEVKS